MFMNKADYVNHFKDSVRHLAGDEYSVIDYDASLKKYHMRHEKCGHEYYVKSYAFVSMGRRCPYCNGGRKISDDEYTHRLNALSTHYRFLSHNLRAHQKTDVKNDVCGHIFSIEPTRLLHEIKNNADFCPSCSINHKHTLDEFKKLVYDAVCDEYIVIGSQYKNNHTKIEMIHNTEECKGHGMSFMVTPKDFLGKNHSRCPYCKESKGEHQIASFLSSHNIVFEQHVRNLGCVSSDTNMPLEFDFMIPNGGVLLLIEYDGRLHFEPYDNTDKSLKRLADQQRRDIMKDDFCKSNGYKLLRIKYTDDVDCKLASFLAQETIESIDR